MKMSHENANRFISRCRPAAVALFTSAVALIGISVASCGPAGAAGGSTPPASASAAAAADVHAAGGADPHNHGAGHADEVVLTPDAIRRNNIRTANATERTLAGKITVPARAAFNAENMAHVGVPLHGRVIDILVRLGDSVKKGDVLLVIQSTELGEAQSNYLHKRTAIELAKPSIELAQGAYDRARQLLEERQGITLTEVQKRLGELQGAQGALRAAEAEWNASANRLLLLGMDAAAIDALAKSNALSPTYKVQAPIEGRVIDRHITLGEQVGPESPPLLTLADTRTVWLVADLPELQLRSVPKSARVEITVPALGGQIFTGTVSYIHPELDAETRTARVRVEVKNPENAILPGMFASLTIDIASAYTQAVVAVPDDAVQTVEGEPAIFVPVPSEKNTFARRAVGIGPSINGWVPVLAGLKKDEPYVITGSFILKAELGKAAGVHEH